MEPLLGSLDWSVIALYFVVVFGVAIVATTVVAALLTLIGDLETLASTVVLLLLVGLAAALPIGAAHGPPS